MQSPCFDEALPHHLAVVFGSGAKCPELQWKSCDAVTEGLSLLWLQLSDL